MGRIGLALAATLAATLAACFSERAEVVAPSLGGTCSVPLDASTLGTTIVAIHDFAFHPAELRVRPGTTVTWVNCDAAGEHEHTSTADDYGWESPLIAPGATFTRTFDAAGSFPYHCEPHPFMAGRVVVD